MRLSVVAVKKADLPDEWDYLVPDAAFIVSVAFQAFLEDGLFVLDALGDEGEIEKHDEERDRRCQDQRHHQEEDGSGHVHRVADDAVQTGIDDFLALLHLYGPGQICILPEDFGIE